MQPGPKNLITDVAGLRVGNAEDRRIKTGVTVLTADTSFTAGVHVMGGAPGTRDIALLSPDKLVQEVHALVLSGGSAFGLDAAGGVMHALRRAGRGFEVGPVRVPIVPAAIVFDLLGGGDKAWSEPPYFALGEAAFAAAGPDFDLGSTGAGTGAVAGPWKGGLGSASLVVGDYTVGALVVANPLGSVTVGDGPHFWAAPFEVGTEFGGLGIARSAPPLSVPTPPETSTENTTIAIVATDAALDKAQATRMATAAHDGMARAIMPSHTPYDGDLVFAAATGEKPLEDPAGTQYQLGHAAALCLARAIARAVFLARPKADDIRPCWSSEHGHGKAGGV